MTLCVIARFFLKKCSAREAILAADEKTWELNEVLALKTCTFQQEQLPSFADKNRIEQQSGDEVTEAIPRRVEIRFTPHLPARNLERLTAADTRGTT